MVLDSAFGYRCMYVLSKMKQRPNISFGFMEIVNLKTRSNGIPNCTYTHRAEVLWTPCVAHGTCYSWPQGWTRKTLFLLIPKIALAFLVLYFLILVSQLALIFNLCIPSFPADCISLYHVYTFLSLSPSWHWFLICVFLLIHKSALVFNLFILLYPYPKVGTDF